MRENSVFFSQDVLYATGLSNGFGVSYKMKYVAMGCQEVFGTIYFV